MPLASARCWMAWTHRLGSDAPRLPIGRELDYPAVRMARHPNPHSDTIRFLTALEQVWVLHHAVGVPPTQAN